MNIQIQAVNFKAKEELLDFLKAKLNKLSQYSDQITNAEAFLKLDNSHDKKNKQCEVVLHVPGDEIVAKKTGESFEECIDNSVEALKRQIIKRKEMQQP